MVDLGETRGHEQAGIRPAVVVSVDAVNHGPAELVIAIPITSRAKRNPAHVAVQPPEGGLTKPSFIKCEDLRSLSHERLIRHMGVVSPSTLQAAEQWMRILLGL
jgi:mRNA interferase MazF